MRFFQITIFGISIAMAALPSIAGETGQDHLGSELTIQKDRDEVIMRPRFDPDPFKRYRGEIEADGYTRLRNPYTGDTVRGYIEPDGYGYLRDSEGRRYRVTPR